MKLTAHVQVRHNVRVREAVPPFPPDTVWCITKERDENAVKFAFTCLETQIKISDT